MSEKFIPGPNCDYFDVLCTRSCLAGSGLLSELAHAKAGGKSDLNSSLSNYKCRHPQAEAARKAAEKYLKGESFS
jgi:hypothetical protein